MKILRRLSVLTVSMLFVIGCGKNSDDEDEMAALTASDEILENLVISVNSNEGVLNEGEIPFSENSSFPTVTSFPDQIASSRLSRERINLVFSVSSSIEEIYFTINGASNYYTFIKTQGESGKSIKANVSDTESVSITVDIPSSINNGNFCMNISVKDVNQSFSDLVQVCSSITDKIAENRVIHFADYSYNSTLSTLNFDTGEVVNIGSIGYKLSDIAFLDDSLYGVTFGSELIAINLDTGEGTVVGSIGVSQVNALEGKDGVLYGASRTGKFLTIDPITAEGTVLSNFEGAYSSGDLVFDKNNELLYGSLIVYGSSTDQLVTIHPSSGETIFIGETGFNDVWGLAFFRNQLLGLTIDGEFIIIDPLTGKGTFIEDTEAFSAGGAAAVRD